MGNLVLNIGPISITVALFGCATFLLWDGKPEWTRFFNLAVYSGSLECALERGSTDFAKDYVCGRGRKSFSRLRQCSVFVSIGLRIFDFINGCVNSFHISGHLRHRGQFYLQSEALTPFLW